jgi:hypothetical protein
MVDLNDYLRSHIDAIVDLVLEKHVLGLDYKGTNF